MYICCNIYRTRPLCLTDGGPVMADILFLKNLLQSDFFVFLQLVTVLRTRCGPKFVGAVAADNAISVF